MNDELTCHQPDPDPDNYHLSLAIVLIVFSAISVLSSSVVVFFYCAYRRMRREFLSLLIFILAVLDILCWLNIIVTSAYYLHTRQPLNCINNELCVFMAFIWSLSELLNYGVTLLISFSLYLALMKNVDPACYKNKMLWILCLVSFVLALIPFFFSADSDLVYDHDEALGRISYGPVDSFKCWITNRKVRITAFYIPMWLVIIMNTVVMVIFLRGLHLGMFNELHDRYHTRFTLFPIIMMVCYVVSSIRRIIQLQNESDKTSFALDLLMYILMPLQGLFNTVVFGMFEEFIRVRIIAFFKLDWRTLRLLNDQEKKNQEQEEEAWVELKNSNN